MDRDEGGERPPEHVDAEPGEPRLSATAEAVLAAVRRSTDVLQELVDATGRQTSLVASLQAELSVARDHIAGLERETARLRAELTTRRPAPEEIEALLEEQNVLAHLFVCSDRLAVAASPGDALQIGVEVMHNLAGVHRYAVWLRPRAGAPVRLVAPAEARYRGGGPPELVARALAAAPGAPAVVTGAAAPLAVPLLLGGAPVGAIAIEALVPQVGPVLGRLQVDLLQFIADRLAPAMCQAAIAAPGAAAWSEVAAALPAFEERSA